MASAYMWIIDETIAETRVFFQVFPLFRGGFVDTGWFWWAEINAVNSGQDENEAYK